MSIVEDIIAQGARIRYELGLEYLKDEEYREECLHRVHVIFNSIFNPEDDVMFIHRSFPAKNNKLIDKIRLKRFFRTSIQQIKLQILPFLYNEPEDDTYIRQWTSLVKAKEIRSSYLFECIYNSDFNLKPNSMGYVYLYNRTSGIMLHMYDDRGCDVSGLNKEVLLPYYYFLRKWILDYDRYDIDQLFNEGLASITETDEERELRQHMNDKKVAVSRIDLRTDNTCRISHHFEIPSVNASKFAEEVSLTGFTVREISAGYETVTFEVSKIEALAIIDYQTHLMSMYGKKYGIYTGWSSERYRK